PATIDFRNSASAGTLTTYYVPGGPVTFVDTPTGGLLLRSPGGAMNFHDRATAEGSTIFLDGGAGNGSIPSELRFYDASTAGAATITAEGGSPGPNFKNFLPNPCDGDGGVIVFYDDADAGTAHLTTHGENRGTGGTPGLLFFAN